MDTPKKEPISLNLILINELHIAVFHNDLTMCNYVILQCYICLLRVLSGSCASSHKRPVPVKETFSASRGCLLAGAVTIIF